MAGGRRSNALPQASTYSLQQQRLEQPSMLPHLPAQLLADPCPPTSSSDATLRQPRRRRITSTSRLMASAWSAFFLQVGDASEGG